MIWDVTGKEERITFSITSSKMYKFKDKKKALAHFSKTFQNCLLTSLEAMCVTTLKIFLLIELVLLVIAGKPCLKTFCNY